MNVFGGEETAAWLCTADRMSVRTLLTPLISLISVVRTETNQRPTPRVVNTNLASNGDFDSVQYLNVPSIIW